MKFATAFALLPLIGSAFAAPASSNAVVRKDGHASDKSTDKVPHYDGKDKDYDHSKHMSHYPENLDCYPNKHCDVRYQNFLDLLLDDVCAKYYQGDRKHTDMEYPEDKKYKRDGHKYEVDDHKKEKHHEEVDKCDDKCKFLDEACRAYYHYQPKDDGKPKDHTWDDGKDHGKDGGKGWGHDDGKKDDGKDYGHDDKKDGKPH